MKGFVAGMKCSQPQVLGKVPESFIPIKGKECLPKHKCYDRRGKSNRRA